MSNTEPKVSIIIPAYNAEKFIERCLDSVAAQTMPDFECIIVDDGSTDRTGEIADEYARNNSRFKVIHQPNGGVSVARQTGIDAATGVYTIQFDADDWVEATMLEEMLREAEKVDADMVICDIYHREPWQNEEVYLSQCPKSLDPMIILGQMMHDLLGSLCNKLIRRKCYQLYDIHFIPKMLSEDQYVCLCLLANPIKVGYVPKAFYHYDRTQNPDSLVNSGISPMERLRPLELIATATDISPIQDYFDKAILLLAYEALFLPKKECPSYNAVFKKYLPSIFRAKGFPFRVKFFIVLRTCGVYLPMHSIKKRFVKDQCKS